MKDYEACQLVELEPQGGLPTDDEMLMDLLARSHALLAQVLQRKLPKGLHGDVAHLFKDLDEALSYHSIH